MFIKLSEGLTWPESSWRKIPGGRRHECEEEARLRGEESTEIHGTPAKSKLTIPLIT